MPTQPSPIEPIFSEDWLTPQVFPLMPPEPDDIANKITGRFQNEKHEFEVYQGYGRMSAAQDPAHVGQNVEARGDGVLRTTLCDGGPIYETKNGVRTFVGGVTYASLVWCPQHNFIDLTASEVTIDFSACLHVSGRRWFDLAILPAMAHISNNAWLGFANTPSSDHNALMLNCAESGWKGYLFDKGAQPSPFPKSHDYFYAKSKVSNRSKLNGIDADARAMTMHRFHITLSATRLRLYEEDILQVDWTFPQALPWGSNVQVMLMQQFYHSKLDVDGMRLHPLTNAFWLNEHPYDYPMKWGPISIK